MFSRLAIHNFRKYEHLTVKLDQHQLVTGPNGFGKTTFLEALFWAIQGYSPIATDTTQLMPHQWDNEPPSLSELFTAVSLDSEGIQLRRVVAWQKTLNGWGGRSTVFINGKSTTQRQVQKIAASIFFSPEYIDLLSLQRSRRLEWIDRLAKVIMPNYTNVLNNYLRVLRQRNSFLRNERRSLMLTAGFQSNEQLFKTYTVQLATLAMTLVHKREQLIALLNTLWNDSLYQLHYQCLKPVDFTPEVLQKERLVGRTLRGPHLDDWLITEKKNVSAASDSLLQWGSRGQRKLALLSLMVLLIDLYKQQGDITPIILLVDPMNELDKTNTSRFRKLLGGDYQIIETRITEGPQIMDTKN